MSAVGGTEPRPPLPLVARRALWFALGWCLLLLVAGFTFPVYGTASASGTGDGSPAEESTGTETLVQANGAGAVAVLLVPLVLAVAVALLLRRRLRVAAWIATGVLGVLTVLALLSIGLFVLPVTIALVVACASASSREARTVGA